MKLRRKEISIFLAASYIFMQAALVFAQEEVEPVKVKNYEFSIGTEIYYYKYEEPNMEQDGIFYGLNLDWRYHIKRFFLHAGGSFGGGEVDYTSPVSGTMDGIDDFVFEIRGYGGYDFDITKNTIMSPFFGIAYRYLNDDTSGRLTSRNHFGYERESNYVYSPLGVETVTDLGNNWSIGLTAEYDFFWNGKQKSNLSETIASYGDLSNDQDSGWGLRGSVRIRKELPKYDIIFEPFIRYWDIDTSDKTDLVYQGVIIGYGLEPENETIEYGVKLKIGF